MMVEVTGLPTSTRVFACYQSNLCTGFLTVDAQRNTVELVYVPDFMRGHGIGASLLEFARETTGLTLDQDTGHRTLEGSRWARARGLKIADGCRYRRIGERDISRQVATLGFALMFAPEVEA